MRNRWIAGLLIVGIILVIGFAAIMIFAPESSAINFLNINNERLDCLKNADDTCLVMPSVTGLDANSAAVVFPEQFSAEYHLVVMPFDREQQVLAVTWLPLFQDLVAEHDNLQYWSIAALPELNTAIRVLVIGGISAGISDPDVRPQVSVLFLEEQDLFLETLAIDSIDEIQAFIMDADGVIYYRAIGEYGDDKGTDFREALTQIID